MTIEECINIIDSLKPNQYSIEDKVRWLSFLDGTIINDIIKTHENTDNITETFEEYTSNDTSVEMIVGKPYDQMYVEYLKMKIDEENGETARYNNSSTMFNAYLLEYKKHYNKMHLPKQENTLKLF